MSASTLIPRKSRMRRNCEAFRTDFQQLVEATPSDVILICSGGNVVETHSEILMTISPVMREVMMASDRNFSLCLPREFKIYVSLQFNEAVVRAFVRSLTQDRPYRVSKGNLEELDNLLDALGVYSNSYAMDQEDISLHSRKDQEEDEAIVDAISNLMDEFNVNSEQSDLAEMLMTTLDESFINDFNDSSNDMTMNNSLECLLSESGDESKSKGQGSPEEALPPAPKRRKMRPTRPPKPQVRDCAVDLENLSDKTLKHYYEMFLKSKTKATEGEQEVKVETENREVKDWEAIGNKDEISNSTPLKDRVTDNSQSLRTPLRRKRKLNVNSEFDYTDTKRKIPRNPASVAVSTEDENSFPHPPISSAPESSSSSSSQANIKQEDSKDVQAVYTKRVKCFMCEEFFNTRSKLLQHMCVSHYQDKIVSLYPFKKGDCSICVEHGRSKPTVIKTRDVHLRHVGQAHELILDLLPEDFKAVLNQEFNVRKRNLNSSNLVKEEPLDDSNLSFASQDSFQESFIDHKIGESDSFLPTYSPSIQPNIEPNFHEDAMMFSHNFGQIESLECRLCKPEIIRAISYRSEMLRHISCDHLGRELLTLYPLPPSGVCNYCPESDQPEVYNEETFIDHIGTYHEKIRHILPNDLHDMIDRLRDEPVAKKIIPGPSVDKMMDNEMDISFKGRFNSTMQDGTVEVGEISFNTSIGSQKQPESEDSIAKFIELSKNVSQENKDSLTAVLKCKHCPDSFDNESDKVKHMQIKHSNTMKVYNCRYCNQQLKGQKAFKLHLLAHKKALVDK